MFMPPNFLMHDVAEDNIISFGPSNQVLGSLTSATQH